MGGLPARMGEVMVMARTPEQERRRAIIWLAIAPFVLALMLGGWWLVESTNREGTHDAQLLPWVTLVPLLIGLYHLGRARWAQRS